MRTTEYMYSIANLIMLKKRHLQCRLTKENYLSNEIFFRVAVLRNYLNLNNILKSRHLHVPILPINNLTKAKSEILNVKKIIGDAIQGL
jgi:hypothetical protein